MLSNVYYSPLTREQLVASIEEIAEERELEPQEIAMALWLADQSDIPYSEELGAVCLVLSCKYYQDDILYSLSDAHLDHHLVPLSSLEREVCIRLQFKISPCPFISLLERLLSQDEMLESGPLLRRLYQCKELLSCNPFALLLALSLVRRKRNGTVSPPQKEIWQAHPTANTTASVRMGTVQAVERGQYGVTIRDATPTVVPVLCPDITNGVPPLSSL
jgi:hypothetical protein